MIARPDEIRMSRIKGFTGCCLKVSCFDFRLSIFICVYLCLSVFICVYLRLIPGYNLLTASAIFPETKGKISRLFPCSFPSVNTTNR